MITGAEISQAKKYSQLPKDFEDGLCPLCKENLEPHLPCCMEMCIGKDAEIHPYESCEECTFTTWELRRGAIDFQKRNAPPTLDKDLGRENQELRE